MIVVVVVSRNEEIAVRRDTQAAHRLQRDGGERRRVVVGHAIVCRTAVAIFGLIRCADLVADEVADVDRQ
jgi:hypothetical protein